jgi:DNA-binding winged helix-turn-helix (wHTH) protein
MTVQFLFADCILDADRRELTRGLKPVAVEPQVFDLLIFLLKNRHRVVSKDDLIASIWDGRIVYQAEAPTGQTPATAGADHQPNNPPTAVVSQLRGGNS